MWTELCDASQLDRLIADSQHTPQIIFKHSTRCSISRVALSRFDRFESAPLGANFYLLDLLNYRPLSQSITERFGIPHESPQLLLIQKGSCSYAANHLEIEPGELKAQIGA